MSFGQQLMQIFGAAPESEIIPHVPEERANLLMACDGTSTEVEVLNVIHAFVRLFKPNLVLETGTYHGMGSVALAAGLKENGFGTLHTLEVRDSCIEKARENVAKFDKDLLNIIRFVHGNSLHYISQYQGPPFDFAFFDSQLNLRHVEFHTLASAGKLAKGAICLFHDTSRLRGRCLPDYCPEVIAYLDDLAKTHEHFEFPYGRGFRFFKLRS